MKVGVVVVHYRQPESLVEVLRAVAGQDLTPAATVVVDNSGDYEPAAEDVRGLRGFTHLRPATNDGYAAAVNAGVAALPPDVEAVLVLTHETILQADTLSGLVDALTADRSLGAVGPLIAYRSRPQQVFSAGGHLRPFTWDTDHVGEGDPLELWLGGPTRYRAWMDGSVILFRAEALQAVGPLREEYFLYFEELDWCIRANRAGWRTGTVLGVLAWQEPGGFTLYLKLRNGLYMRRRLGGNALALRWVLRRLAAFTRDALLRGASVADAREVARGIRDGLRSTMGPPRPRRGG